MIRLLLSIGILFFISSACKKSKDDDGCFPEKFEYFFNNNKEIDTIQHFPNIIFASAVNGNDIVFTYRYSSRTCPTIADDGYTDQLLFQVAAGSNSFNYTTTTDLQNNKCYFLRSCFCGNVSSRIVAGTIKGTRLNSNRWAVEATVVEPVTNITKSFKKEFVLQ